MSRTFLPLFCALLAAGCRSYEPAPVDLAAHARDFGLRLVVDVRSPQAFVDGVGIEDGIDPREARILAATFHPTCRLARQRVDGSALEAAQAGRVPDPVFNGDLLRILEDVAHPWLAQASLNLTLPITGRLGLEQALAFAARDHTAAAAVAAELAAEAAADAAFAAWRAARERLALLQAFGERLRELERIAARLAEADQVTQQEARAFTLERLQRDLDRSRATAGLRQAEIALLAALGLHPAAPLPFVAAPPPAPVLATPDARAAAIGQSPRLASARAAHAAAERELELEIRKQWPDLVLGPRWEEEDAQPRVALGFWLPIPILSANAAGIATAEAQRLLTAETLRTAFEQVTQDLALAEQRLAAAGQQKDLIAQQLVPLAEQQLADGRALADLGRLQPLLLLDALGRLYDARSAAVDAELAEAEALAALHGLLGAATPTAPTTPTTRTP
jgi:cobalt-zinc-cadmium efflux system outer membrane protein